MNAWIKDGRVVFIPLPGATPVAAADVVEELDGPLAANEQVGPIDSVVVEGGKVKIKRKRRIKDKRTKALEDLDAANNIVGIKRALKELL